MNRAALVRRVRSYTRDFSNSVFREIDVTDFIDEAIDRVSSYITQLKNMIHLPSNENTPILLPDNYHYLLSIFSASRCFAQDERNYQATTLMNEFETKLDELKTSIENGEITIVDADGNAVAGATDNLVDFVQNVYFKPIPQTDEDDDGEAEVMG